MKRKSLAIILAAILTTAANAEVADEFFEEDAQVVRLEETVITGEITETTVRNTTKNITILTRKDIEKKGARNIVEALDGVAGLKASEGFGFGSLDLRGQGGAHSSNVLILLDGIRQNPIDMGGARINNIDIENIQRIEVISGGGSVLYGDGAVGGIINIITKKLSNTEGSKTIFVEAGNNDTMRYGVNVAQNLSENLLFNFNYSDSNNGGYRENGDFDTENFELGLKYKLQKMNSISYSYGHYSEEYGLPGSLSEKEMDKDRRETNSPDKNAEYTTDSHTLAYNYKISDNIEFMIDGNFRKNDYDSIDSGKTNTAYDNSQAMIKPKVKFTYGTDNSNVIFGYDYYLGTSEVKNYFGDEVDRDLEKSSNSLFALNNYNVGKFQFIQGLRYEKTDYDLKADKALESNLYYPASYTDADTSNTAIELAINYLYSDTGSTYISYSDGFRTPNTGELAKSSNDIKEQTHSYIEVGVKDVILNSFISASMFKSNIKNELYYDSVNYVNTNLNGKSEKLGIELSAEQYLDKLTINETFTFLDTEMQDGPYKGKEIPGVSKYTYTLAGNYQLNEKIMINGSANYNGESYSYNDYNNDGNKVKAYTTVDGKLAYDLKSGLVIYGGVNNILDEKYYNYVGSYDSYSGGKVYYYYPAAERTYYAGFKYNF